MIFGTEEWYDHFYRKEKELTLFGEADRLEKAPIETIGTFFNQRLKSIFPGVVETPGILRNTTNRPLYLLCFAAANRNGAPIALRIARDLLKGLQ